MYICKNRKLKILFNKLEEFLEMKKKYHKELKKIYAKNKYEYDNVYLKLIKKSYIKNCQKIINKELKKGTKKWLFAKSYFSHPYSISIWNNDKDIKFIKWNEKIMNISIKKLSKILENSDKKYLELRCNFCLCGWMQKTVKLKKENL